MHMPKRGELKSQICGVQRCTDGGPSLCTVRLEWMKGLGNPPNIWVPWYCKLAICKLFCGKIEFVSLHLRKIWAP